MIRRITTEELTRADVVVRPDIDEFPIFGFKHCDEPLQRGREVAKEVMPAIKEMFAVHSLLN